MSSAYDANEIHAHSRSLGHVPLIAPHGSVRPLPHCVQESLRRYDKPFHGFFFCRVLKRAMGKRDLSELHEGDFAVPFRSSNPTYQNHSTNDASQPECGAP
jgi:hypothetical protein